MQTRYLFIMVTVDLVKYLLINNHKDFGHNAFTAAIINLSNHGLLKEIGDMAVQLIDDYLTNGNDDCLFNEPQFLKNRDLNAFLKSDKLGKGDTFSPNLHTQITLAKKMFKKNANIEQMKAALATAN